MMRPPKPGLLLVTAGAIHVTLMTIGSHALLADIARHGVIGAVSLTSGDMRYAAALWSIIAGMTLIIIGLIYNWAETTLKRPVPARFGWAVAGLAFAGALIAPVGGFWGWAIVGLYAVWYAKTR